VAGVCRDLCPGFCDSVEHYQGTVPIFDAYGVETELSRSLERRIWLKSGGYVIIEKTEALTAIDVNTGRYVGSYNLEETILKTNLEAVKEIAYQLG
jgi:ribonuclease G